MEMYFKRMKDEWTGLVEQADPFIRAKAAEIALAHAHYLSIEFLSNCPHRPACRRILE